MKPEEIALFSARAAPLFVVPAAAEALHVAALSAAPGSDLRNRAARALACLDPDKFEVHEQPLTNYYMPEQAAALFRAAEVPEPSEQRTRAQRALAWLDASRDLGELALDCAEPGSHPLLPFAFAFATVQLQLFQTADTAERRKLGKVIRAVCSAASEIAKRRSIALEAA